MCGINGLIKPDINENDINNVLEMNNILSHRGPDNSDIWSNTDVVFGHTRLAIIDLNQRSNQPFKKDNYVIIFNGEIYNYKELKKKLPEISFSTDSDTEVILELWKKYKENSFDMLRGMFAFAIYDTITNETIIARDHFGIKPLYFYKDEKKIIFSSEIKAIKKIIGKNLNVSKEAIVASTLYCWVPEKNCIFNEVEKLEPGEFIKIKDNVIKISKYWSNRTLIEKKPSLKKIDDTIEKLSHTLEDSVEKHLVSDVPVNAFLSGGLDSSLLVAIAKNKVENIDCYNIKFSDVDQKYEANSDDSYYATKVAKKLNVKLNTLEVKPNLTNLLEKIVYYLDEPIGDSAAINTYLICENAKNNGVKVLLSGMGSDEIFSGYRKHRALQIKSKLNFIPSGILGYINNISQNIPVKSKNKGLKFFRWMKRFLDILKYSENNKAFLRSYTYYDINKFDEIFDFKSKDYSNSIFNNFDDNFSYANNKRDLLDAMNFVDLNDFMVSLNLKYTDLASMAASTEVRVPYIDMEVIKIAFQINSKFKIKNNEQKFILKKVAEKWLPNEIIYRPKAGFTLPLRAWIKKDLNSVVSEYILSENGLKKRSIFKESFLKKIVYDEHSDKEDNSQKIWQLLTLEQWFRNLEKSDN
jgi:asparagine synthase (glutamine-hydrolysing)